MSGPVDVTNMLWRPAMVRLTLVQNPSVDDGKETACYVDPSAIGGVWRAALECKDGTLVSCTRVHCCHYEVVVTEMPEQVAMLRDRALGYNNKPTPIK